MAKKIVRKAGDAAGVGPYARERERLVPISEMRGWNVADGEADIRSWEVKTISGKTLGSVRELLVDANAGEVVMLDVDLAGSDRHAYVPIRVVEIDRARREVRADSADLEEHGVATDKTRFTAKELASVRKDVRYADATAERVVERRPIVEETVVRRRAAADDAESRL
jgi:hypothetical protein